MTSEALHISVDYTDKILKQAQVEYQMHLHGRKLLFWGLASALALGYIIFTAHESLHVRALAVAPVLFGWQSLASISGRAKQFAELRRDETDRTAAYELTEEAIEEATSLRHTDLKWNSSMKLWKALNMWLLCHGKYLFCVFPAPAISEELKGFMTSKIKQVGGQIRVYRVLGPCG